MHSMPAELCVWIHAAKLFQHDFVTHIMHCQLCLHAVTALQGSYDSSEDERAEGPAAKALRSLEEQVWPFIIICFAL